MKIQTFYTPSHSRLVAEHFRPSAERFFGQGNVTCQLVDDVPEGSYGTPEFAAFCQKRLSRYISICEEKADSLVLSDADVRFYGDVPSDLETCAAKYGHDAYFQWDGKGGHCMGFVFVRCREAFVRLCRQMQEELLGNDHLDDQQALRRLVVGQKVQASLGILPTVKYWTSGLSGHIWLPGDNLSPPKTMLMHHGNWTFGTANKLELLATVARMVGLGA